LHGSADPYGNWGPIELNSFRKWIESGIGRYIVVAIDHAEEERSFGEFFLLLKETNGGGDFVYCGEPF